jgi:DUF4097 and DUF4098 domain-containing protein YvlB
MKIIRLCHSALLAAIVSLLLSTTTRAADDESSSIKFSNPSQPGTLKVSVTNGDIRIRGVDTAEVTVQTELKPETQTQRKDGLRVLTSSSSYKLTEKDNVVTLSYGTDSWPGSGGDFNITVPRNTNIVISNAFGGDISIGELTGDVEVKSLNGEVKLQDLSGGALVETMNGEIHADVVALKDGKPLSFTSMNGEVSLNLPADAKANVRLRTHNGSILTDFDENQLVTTTASLRAEGRRNADEANAEGDKEERKSREAAKAARDAARDAERQARRSADVAVQDGHVSVNIQIPPIPPLPPMTGGKIVTGTLNGGGPEIRITTMNGNVTIRKADHK